MNLNLDTLYDDSGKALERGKRPSIRDCAKSEAAIPELTAIVLNHQLAAGNSVTPREYFERYPTILMYSEATIRLVAIECRAAVNRDSSISEWHFQEHYADLANASEWCNGPWVNDTVLRDRGEHHGFQLLNASQTAPGSHLHGSSEDDLVWVAGW